MNCTRFHLRFYSTSHFNLKQTPGSTKVDDALQVFDEMLQRQPPPSIVQFNKLITLIVKMKHYSTALSLFKKVNLMGIPSNLYAMTISINCHCRLNQVAYGFALLATIFKLGYPPSLATYTTLIHGLVLADWVFEVVELFKKLLREKVCEPDQITFGVVINGLCKVGDTSKALELLRFMEPVSCKCKPSMGSNKLMKDVNLYNILIKGCRKCGKLDLAMDLFGELSLKGLKPNVRTYTVTISVLCQQGLFGEANNLLRKMEENGCSPNSVTCNVIVQEFLKQKAFQEAEILLEEMIIRGFSPDSATFEMLLHHIPSKGQDSPMRIIIQKLTNKQ
ncbi:putative tetratricopeptide-like helical domain superfamily [Helianthus annuus]|nr:putative tetratricopeptide-like helical domain superfamily [Helianthus annuus]KAJ0732604.1 putative tetratricopeptide-like helical domain superfamily [Helianthus annuus]KAJ0906255.1 putative tetratricopeptide-like helical domain superfamily [Helianthus annuus]